MRICEEHRGLESAEEGTCEVAGVWWNATPLTPAPCRMIEMVSALRAEGMLVVERTICQDCEGSGRMFAGGTHAEWGPCSTCQGYDYEWPDWAYEGAAKRLQLVGNTDQWQSASYRMAYLNIVLKALFASQPADALAEAQPE